MSRTGKIAVWLVVVSCAFWAGLLLLPFIDAGAGTKAVLAVAFIAAGEITFWGGALIVGLPLMKRYRHRLSLKRWFAQRREHAPRLPDGD